MNPIRMISTALLCGLAACSKSAEPVAAPAPAAPIPVTVATAETSDTPIRLRAIGSVQPRAVVVLKPQIAGRIESLSAADGVDVSAGQVLIRIDPRPFDAARREAEANAARQETMTDDAHHLVERIRAANLSASQRELEEAEAKAAAGESEVLEAKAQVETARLNLSYCEIAAPFAGKLGEFLVKPGSIVKANETELVEVTQIDPIDVAFSVPEENIPAVRQAAAGREGGLPVEALPSGDTGEPLAGTLTFIDSKVDAATGAIRLKATYANPERRLWPARFTNVSLVLGHETGVSVPESAVQPSQDGPAVFVVKPDKTVEFRRISVRRTVDGRSIIAKGVEAGETVVTDGQLRLTSGAQIQVKSAATASAKGQPS